MKYWTHERLKCWNCAQQAGTLQAAGHAARRDAATPHCTAQYDVHRNFPLNWLRQTKQSVHSQALDISAPVWPLL